MKKLIPIIVCLLVIIIFAFSILSELRERRNLEDIHQAVETVTRSFVRENYSSKITPDTTFSVVETDCDCGGNMTKYICSTIFLPDTAETQQPFYILKNADIRFSICTKCAEIYVEKVE